MSEFNLDPVTHDSAEFTERSAWVRLSLTCGVGPQTIRALLKTFGLPTAVFEASSTALTKVVGDTLARTLAAAPQRDIEQSIEHTHHWLAQDPKRFLLTLADADYPSALLATTDPPPVLYGIGNRALLATPLLAIVGARASSTQGERNASAFAQSLARAGLTIVSGMARGIDAAAHQGALNAQAPTSTIAIVGTGADRVYPTSNRNLYQAICEQGLLLSEYALGTPPLAHHFPRRNRILAGLSQGVLVVEAAQRSGSLISARLAAELGREVFAIPGSIHSPLARGCHQLIRDGAKLVESAQDILEELRFSPTQTAASTTRGAHAPALALPPALSKVLQALGHDPIDTDTLCERTGMDAGSLSASLLELELAHHIERLPGNRYQKI